MRIPWARPYLTEQEAEAVANVVRSGWISSGPKTRELEASVGAFLGVRHAIAVSSGTAALDVALAAAGIGPGDEVVVPAVAYVATVNSVAYRGARPVFADIEPVTFNLDPDAVEAKVTKRTRAVLSTGYAGHPQDYDGIRAVAERRGLLVVDDAAQTLGAEYNGKPCGSLTPIATTSFHTAKIVTSVEGGMVFTDDDSIAEAARVFRNQGEGTEKYIHRVIGHNYRMTDVHAAIGLVQFSRISDVLQKRRSLAAYYSERLASVPGVATPTQLTGCTHAWFAYAVQVDARDRVVAAMKEREVETRVMYPVPVNRQPAYLEFNEERYPVSERFCAQVLNLPMYYDMTRAEQDYVMDALADALHRL